MKRIVTYISVLVIPLLNGCIEEFNAGTIQFQDNIVIECVITNQLKHQTVRLSRTFKLEEQGPNNETGATVEIHTPNNTYTFNETEPGIYTSNEAFQAQANTTYTLKVNTSDGRTYESEPTMLTNETQIDDLYAERIISDDGVDGIGIFVDSFDPTNNSRYYGYQFESTHEIIVPLWHENDYIILNNDPFEWTTGPREQEERVCYKTINSVGRMLTNTNFNSEDRVARFMIEFIPLDDIRISTRYSLLLKQYIQNEASYHFHETLNELSLSENIFSQTQAGFIDSNIYSLDNQNDKVAGYFEVSSVSEQRLFINRSDFTDEPYDWNCQVYSPGSFESNFDTTLEVQIKFDRISLVETGPPVLITFRQCGDCTVWGSNIKPDFWID